MSRESERCNRCINNELECAFQQPARAKHRFRPYPDATAPTVSSHRPPGTQKSNHHLDPQEPPVTAEVRTRILAALATLKGRRGSPFTFVAAGNTPRLVTDERDQDSQVDQAQGNGTSQVDEPSLPLTSILRPLGRSVQQCHEQAAERVTMPSYVSALSLGHTISDPIASGALSLAASSAFYNYFLREMNAKWEYVLDPRADGHDAVRRRSPLLFACILFCAAKFAQFRDGSIINVPDTFLQTRLCSVTRNLAVRAFAEGSRAIETMQAFYLLACWKEVDDDVSYLHCGYAFRVLHDLDLQGSGGGEEYIARRRRTWLALYRQEKQQSLFFVRGASLVSEDDDGSNFVGDWRAWRGMPHAIPLDAFSCCSAELRRTQARIQRMIRNSSSEMLSCLSDMMEADLVEWRSRWQSRMNSSNKDSPVLANVMANNDDTAKPDDALFSPGVQHFELLHSLWEHSVRLNLASAMLRRALGAAVAVSTAPADDVSQLAGHSSSARLPSLRSLESRTVVDMFSNDIVGLRGSIEGAFGTLRQLGRFLPQDLRRAPDTVVLLGPNAALFLCLLLCLPCKGLLGPAFQRTTIGLISSTAQHFRGAVESPQDTMSLHADYLESLEAVLIPSRSDSVAPQASTAETGRQGTLGMSMRDGIPRDMNITDAPDFAAESAAQVLASGFAPVNNGEVHHAEQVQQPMPDDYGGLMQQFDVQSLANLLNPAYFTDGVDFNLDAF